MVNKIRRSELFQKEKKEKSFEKAKRRKKRQMIREELGEEGAPPLQKPRTIENTRLPDETFVKREDEEVFGDEKDDEFFEIFSEGQVPKIMITTRPRPSRKLFPFIGDLMTLFPNSFYYPREGLELETICRIASSKDFTHLIVLGEKKKKCNKMIISKLPEGPTAYFKVSSIMPSSDVPNRGAASNYTPELILNHFNTRLGRRTARLLASLYPQSPEIEGRQVVTLHNQRDYIFVRFHRYVKRKWEGLGKDNMIKKTGRKSRIALQEIGPRFTLKLRWIMTSTFTETSRATYEWIKEKARSRAKKNALGGKKKKQFHL